MEWVFDNGLGVYIHTTLFAILLWFFCYILSVDLVFEHLLTVVYISLSLLHIVTSILLSKIR